MKRQLLLAVAMMTAGWMLSGCAGSRQSGLGSGSSNLPPFVVSLDDWPERYRQNFENLRTFHGDARLTVESEQFGGNVDLETVWRSPDKLFLKAEGPLGLDIGKIFVGQERFIWYNQYENHYTAGNLSDPYLNRFLQTNITLEDLKYTVLGYTGQIADNVRLVDSTHGVFESVDRYDDEISYRFVVNPKSGLLETVEALRQNRPYMRQDFRNYRIFDGIYMPGIVQVTMLDQRERVSIFYKSIKVNGPVAPHEYTIEISSKVEQLNVN